MTIVGTFNRYNCSFSMFNKDGYIDCYIGYSLKDMKRRYRQDNGLERKHLTWIITGLENNA